MSEHQGELIAAVRDVVADLWSPEQRRELLGAARPWSERLWQALTTDLGLIGIGIEESAGGSGGDLADLGASFEVTGYALVGAPLLAGVLAAQTLARVGERDALARVISGETLATVAWADDVEVADNRLTGTLPRVLDGESADLLLLLQGDALWLIDLTVAGVQRLPRESIDLTRRHADVILVATPARRVAATRETTRWVSDLRTVLHGCETVGAAQACLDMMTDYAKIRRQFGRPIGSFQAVKHQCAEVALGVETARSAVRWACEVATSGASLSEAASITGAWCPRRLAEAAAACVQVHGGIGFTWEHDAHLYLRRATAARLLFGTAPEHLANLADAIGL